MLLPLIFALLTALATPALAVQETQTDRSDPRDGHRQSEQPSGAGLLGRALWGGWAIFTGRWGDGCSACHGGSYGTTDPATGRNPRDEQAD